VICITCAAQFARVARVWTPISFTPQTLGEFPQHTLACRASSGAAFAGMREPVALHARFA
jgi:hypothetical protein